MRSTPTLCSILNVWTSERRSSSASGTSPRRAPRIVATNLACAPTTSAREARTYSPLPVEAQRPRLSNASRGRCKHDPREGSAA
eukprot:8071060-Pyramimonas_sp.AAC.1